MRRDWDERAERDARFFIASGTADADAFWRSGQEEADALILSEVELEPGASALEIGCGIGRLLLPLSRLASSVVGVDISPRMIAEARRACANVENIRIDLTDGTLASVPDRSQDFVFSYIVFQHIPERRAIDTYVKEAARTLQPGGIFHFQVDGRVRRREQYTPGTYEGITLDGNEVRQMVDAAGLEVVRQWGQDTHYLWTTSRAPGSGARVRLVARIRDDFEMRALEQRLSATCGMPVAVGHEGEIRRVMDSFVQRHRSRSATEFVGETFRVLLDREALAAELEFARTILEGGLESPENWIDTIVTSTELRTRLTPSVPRLSEAAEGRLRQRLSSGGREGERLPATLGDLMAIVAAQLRGLDCREAVRRAYQLILGCEPDSEGHRNVAEKLRLGHVTIMTVVAKCMLRS